MAFFCNVLEIFSAQRPQALSITHTGVPGVKVDYAFYTGLTIELLSRFYPKYCCGEQLTQVDGNRHLMLRCPVCHKQKSMLVGTPLEQMKHPLWMFSYLVKEAQVRYPAVITTSEISRRLGVSMHGAKLLKRRIQIFASDVLPRMKEKVYQDLKTEFTGFNLPDDRNTDLTELVRDRAIPQTDVVVLYSCAATANKGRKRFKRKGQTASIYRSESLGGDQVGTMVNTFARKQGPVFYDSVSDQQASTLNPLLKKLMPVSTPLTWDTAASPAAITAW